MGKIEKTLTRLLWGTSDSNIRFSDLCRLLIQLGFQERIKGDRHIYTKEGVLEILNLQPKSGKAKSYQVKQVRNIILFYKMGGAGDE